MTKWQQNDIFCFVSNSKVSENRNDHEKKEIEKLQNEIKNLRSELVRMQDENRNDLLQQLQELDKKKNENTAWNKYTFCTCGGMWLLLLLINVGLVFYMSSISCKCNTDDEEFVTTSEFTTYSGNVSTNLNEIQTSLVDDCFVCSFPPTWSPISKPSDMPTKTPTSEPSSGPSKRPSYTPTHEPSELPTQKPTISPVQGPTDVPTPDPTNYPTDRPTLMPTMSNGYNIYTKTITFVYFPSLICQMSKL